MDDAALVGGTREDGAVVLSSALGATDAAVEGKVEVVVGVAEGPKRGGLGTSGFVSVEGFVGVAGKLKRFEDFGSSAVFEASSEGLGTLNREGVGCVAGFGASVGAVTVMVGMAVVVFALSRFSFSFAASSSFAWLISASFLLFNSRSFMSAWASNSCFSNLEYVLNRVRGLELVLSAKLGEPLFPTDEVLDIEEIRLTVCDGIWSKGFVRGLPEELKDIRDIR